MRRLRATLLAALLAASFGACAGPSGDLRRFAPPDADRFARDYLALVAAGRHDSAAAYLGPTMPGADRAKAIFAAMQPILGTNALDTARIIGVQVNSMGHASGMRVVHANISYEMQVPRGWLVANVASFDSAGRRWVEGFHASLMEQSLEQQHAFTLSGRSAKHWLWLLATVAAVGTSLGTAVFVALQRGMPRRFLWALAATLGVGRWMLFWSTGASAFSPFMVQFLSGGFFRPSPAASWMLSFGFPVGAMLALRRWRAWKRGPAPGAEAAPPAPAVAT